MTTSEKVIRTTTKLQLPINGWIRLSINTIAVLVSWFFNKSILWAIFHFMFGTWYLIYRLLKGSFRDGGFMQIINNYI